MATQGIDGQNSQNPVYKNNYLDQVKTNDQGQAQSLFNALWDEAAKMVSKKADADGNGVVDKNDLPLLNQLMKNLQRGQKMITKNLKKYTYFDAEKIRNGFETCEQSLKQIAEKITSGTYIAQEDENQAAYEPVKTDAERDTEIKKDQFNTPYYRDLMKKANDRLVALQDEKSKIEQEESSRISLGLIYTGRSTEDAGESAMKEIAQMFLGDSFENGAYVHADRNDVNCLIQWASDMWSTGKITGGEKNILANCAKETIAQINQREAQGKAQNNSYEEVASAQNQNDTWDKLLEIMLKEGHSHDGVADWGVLGYSKDEALAKLQE